MQIANDISQRFIHLTHSNESNWKWYHSSHSSTCWVSQWFIHLIHSSHSFKLKMNPLIMNCRPSQSPNQSHQWFIQSCKHLTRNSSAANAHPRRIWSNKKHEQAFLKRQQGGTWSNTRMWNRLEIPCHWWKKLEPKRTWWYSGLVLLHYATSKAQKATAQAIH